MDSLTDSDLGPLEGTEFDSRPISSRTRGGGNREGVRGQSDAAPKARSNAGQTIVDQMPDHTQGNQTIGNGKHGRRRPPAGQ